MTERTSLELQTHHLGRQVTDLTIRFAVVAALVVWCFLLFMPFLMVLLWGIILAVALSPVFTRLQSMLGGRRKLAGAVFILVGVGILVVPAIFLAESFADGLKSLTVESHETIQIPPPPDGVAEWPVIGARVHALWTGASTNLETTLHRFAPEIKTLGTRLISTLTGFGLAFLLTIVSIIIAGIMLMHADDGVAAVRAIGRRIAGARGQAAVDLAGQAIRSVAYGVVGVAAAQSILSAVGLYLADVPGAALWSGLILILAVAQLPPLLILGPAIIYVTATSDSTVVTVLFGIWSIAVSFSDAILKPMLLGRGLDIPMPVILIGAIGGMIRAGIIGLFVGAVVMAIGYKLYRAWMAREESEAATP